MTAPLDPLDADELTWAWPDEPQDREPATDTPTTQFPATWRLLDDVELMALADPDFLIADMIPRRSVGVIYAPSGAGKTTFLAALTTAVAQLPSFYGHSVRHRGASCYVATEDPAGFKVRLRAAKRAAKLPLDAAIGVYTFPEPIDLRDSVSVAGFSRFLQQQSATLPLELVIVDTYAAATPGASENSSEDTTTAMVHAQQWRDRLGVTVILVHHTNAGGSRERGHTAMRGAADFMIAMTPVDDVIHVECSKQRNAAPFERLTLRLTPMPDGDGCILRRADDVIQGETLTPAQTKVLAVLRETFGADGATKTEWQRTCADVNERTFHRAAKVLADRGFIKAYGSHWRDTGKAVQGG
ncbi:MAG TPA: AAA family ATPase [Vicinamibacterales bacterium]